MDGWSEADKKNEIHDFLKEFGLFVAAGGNTDLMKAYQLWRLANAFTKIAELAEKDNERT